jgi:hypothetical protein
MGRLIPQWPCNLIGRREIDFAERATRSGKDGAFAGELHFRTIKERYQAQNGQGPAEYSRRIGDDFGEIGAVYQILDYSIFDNSDPSAMNPGMLRFGPLGHCRLFTRKDMHGRDGSRACSL